MQSDRYVQHAKYINGTVDGLLDVFGSKRLSVIGLEDVILWTATDETEENIACFALLLLHNEGDMARCRRIGILRCSGSRLRPLYSPEGVDSSRPRWERYEGILC